MQINQLLLPVQFPSLRSFTATKAAKAFSLHQVFQLYFYFMEKHPNKLFSPLSTYLALYPFD